MITDISRVSYTDYQEYKAALDAELQQSAESFVRIGYMLKLARDTDILTGSGYNSVNEFAREEYNIDKTMVSRFISINDRFSEGGNSDRLQEQYRGFGYAKLTLMLQLPDAVAEELSPEFSKTDVQAIKEEVEAERQISDLEVMMEEKDKAKGWLETNLQKVLYQLGMENPEKYRDIHTAMKAADRKRTLNETLAPTGENIYSVRIPGTGRLMLSVKGMDRDISLVNVRTGEKETYTWSELELAAELIVNAELSAEASYELNYEKDFPKTEPVPEPKKQEIAPVQPKKEPKKQKKQEKVTKAKPKKEEAAAPETVPEEQEPERIAPEDVEIVEIVENTKSETDFEEDETVLTENETALEENETGKATEAAEIPNEKSNRRLTESDDLGNWGVKGLPWKELQVGQIITREVYEKLYGCLCKLKDYEETGLSPEEVERLAEKGGAE